MITLFRWILLKQKKIDCKLFPEALSVVIEFFVPIINKTILFTRKGEMNYEICMSSMRLCLRRN